MAPLFDASSNTPSARSTEQDMKLPRLFHLDLPRLTQTGQPLPEQAESSAFHRILDVASETGQWAIRVARAAPQMQIVGIEGNTALLEQARIQARGIDNVTFNLLDPFQRLDLSENAFDLVNARYLTGLLPASDWSSVLKEFVRVTRPQGVLRLTETDLPITNSAALERLSGWIGKAYSLTGRSFSPTGRLLSITPMLKGLLQEAGCQQVEQVVWNTNFSAGMPAYTEVTEDLARTYRLVQPFLASVGVATSEEIEQAYQQMLADIRSERFTANAFSLTVWGIKP